MTEYDIDLLVAYIESQAQSAAREVESLSLTQARALLELLPDSSRKRLVRYILPSYIARYCFESTSELSIDILNDLDLQGQVAVLRLYNTEKQNQILKALPDNNYGFARILLSYAEDNIGAWMDTNILLLPLNISVGDALTRVTEFEGTLDADKLLIVDDDNRLRGSVSLTDLLSMQQDTPLQKCNLQSLPSLYARSSLEHAADHDAWKKSDSLVLLNRKNEVIGVLQHHQLRRAQAKKKLPELRSESSPLGDLAGAYGASLLALFDLLVDRKEPGV